MLIKDYLIEMFNKYEIKYNTRVYKENRFDIEVLDFNGEENSYNFVYLHYPLEKDREIWINSNQIKDNIHNANRNYGSSRYFDLYSLTREVNKINLNRISEICIYGNLEEAEAFIKKLPVNITVKFYLNNYCMESVVSLGNSETIRTSFIDDKLYFMLRDFLINNKNLQFLDYIQDNYPETEMWEILC